MAREYYFYANHDGKAINVRLSYFTVHAHGRETQIFQRAAITTGKATGGSIGVPLKSQSWEFHYAYLMDSKIQKAFITEIYKSRGQQTSLVKYRVDDIDIVSIVDKTDVTDIFFLCSKMEEAMA